MTLFCREWVYYENGFGDFAGSFWLGLCKLARLTAMRNASLYVYMEDFDGNSAYAMYSIFYVAGAVDKYRLTIGDYIGTAGDSLAGLQQSQNGMQFSTKDSDNDRGDRDCANLFLSAGWFRNCLDANMNGPYYTYGPLNPSQDFTGVVWREFRGSTYSLRRLEMKIR